MVRKRASKGRSGRRPPLSRSPSNTSKTQRQQVRVKSLFLRMIGPLFLLVGVPVLAFGIFVLRPLQMEQDGVVITVGVGQPLIQIAQQLDDKHVIADAMAFRLLAVVSGDSRSIQAGTYRFDGTYTPMQVLKRLVAGKVELVRCTFPEGLRAQQVVDLCVKMGLGDAGRFTKLITDEKFSHNLKIDVPSLEGYLFPETYSFAPGSSEKMVLRAMVVQLQRHLDDKLLQQAKKHGLDRNRLLTLASIIQKEAGNEQEMPLISAVFHNRLKRGMLLQADPTVIYGIKNFNGNLTRKDLLTASPYNTYQNKGLPPGPIANPGMAALSAAANPAVSPALYFVADGSGVHKFSNTLTEHNRAVRRYQLHRR